MCRCLKTEARERYLSPDEVQRLFAELDRSPQPQIGQIIRLLLFTGARKRGCWTRVGSMWIWSGAC